MDPLTTREARARDLDSARRRLTHAKLAAVAASVLTFGSIAAGIAITTPAVTATDGSATTTASATSPATAASPTAAASTTTTIAGSASTTTRKTTPSRVVSAQS